MEVASTKSSKRAKNMDFCLTQAISGSYCCEVRAPKRLQYTVSNCCCSGSRICLFDMKRVRAVKGNGINRVRRFEGKRARGFKGTAIQGE